MEWNTNLARSGLALAVLAMPAVAMPTVAMPAVAVATEGAGGGPASALGFDEVSEQLKIEFEHFPPERFQTQLALLQSSLQSPIGFQDIVTGPAHARGKAGVALLDFDGDGDLDIYATNGLGHANALFSNQLAERGVLEFEDVAAQAGVAAIDHESSGTCFADVNNDGAIDLFVVGDDDEHLLFLSRGDGTFDEIGGYSGGAFGGDLGGVACTFADVDGDGLVDLFVGHTWPQTTVLPCVAEPFALNRPNELFHNLGGGAFEDVSASSGILTNGGVPEGAHTITWAVAAFDYDQDGDVDLMTADDTCGMANASHGGVDRGFIQLFENDGSGHFDNVTLSAGLTGSAAHMGISVADFDADGHLDVFVTNAGDYYLPMQGFPPTDLGEYSSRWYLGSAAGTFSDPGVGPLVATPFGWGTSAEDFDADGDTDVAFMGGIDAVAIYSSDNPGTVLENDGSAHFTFDPAALEEDNTLRNPIGLAAGDLDGDGFVDLVNVSNFDYGSAPLAPVPLAFGSPFDALARVYFPMQFVGEDALVWNGIVLPNGSLTVELNRGNENGTLAVQALGSVGLTSAGRVNRSGIGAVFSVTPDGGVTARKPVMGGSSCSSQDSLELHFGLGAQPRATVDALWPGGVRNRLYGVDAGERVVFPEIPCSFTDGSLSTSEYGSCVRDALGELSDAGVLSNAERARFLASALRARAEQQGPPQTNP